MNNFMTSANEAADRLAKIESEEQRRRSKFEQIERWYMEHKHVDGRSAAVPTSERVSDGEIPAPVAVDVVPAPQFVVDVPTARRPAINLAPAQRSRSDDADKTELIRYPDGDAYEGQVSGGKKHGRGTFTFANGDKYVGEFKDDQRNGRGVYIYKSGARYDGDFVDGKRHGRGAYRYANGDSFEGTFDNGKKSGAGVYTYADGAQVRGTWENDALLAPE